jgi:hypothetical protein
MSIERFNVGRMFVLNIHPALFRAPGALPRAGPARVSRAWPVRRPALHAAALGRPRWVPECSGARCNWKQCLKAVCRDSDSSADSSTRPLLRQ